MRARQGSRGPKAGRGQRVHVPPPPATRAPASLCDGATRARRAERADRASGELRPPRRRRVPRWPGSPGGGGVTLGREAVRPAPPSGRGEPAGAPVKARAGGRGSGSRICACVMRVRARWGRHARAPAALAHRDLRPRAVRSLVPTQGPIPVPGGRPRLPQTATAGAPGRASCLAAHGRRFPASHQVAPLAPLPFGHTVALVPNVVTRGPSWAAPQDLGVRVRPPAPSRGLREPPGGRR